MSGRRSRDWETERANLRRGKGSTPRASRRSRSLSRNRRRSPRRFRRSPSTEPRRLPSGPDVRGRHDRGSGERGRYKRSRSRERFEPLEHGRNRERYETSEYGRNREIYEAPEHGRNREMYEPLEHERNRETFGAPEFNRGGEIYEPESTYEAPPICETQRFSPPPITPFHDMDISFQTPETPVLDNEDIMNGESLISNLESIPDFDPENSQLTAREWIRIVDSFAHKKKWTKEEKKYHMSQKLIGVGRQWYLATNKVDCTWAQLKQQFIAAFPSDMDYYTLLHNMFERKKKKDESYATYFTQKVGLLENCGITGAKAVSCIIGGLPASKIRDIAFRRYFKTVDALYEFLREEEKQENFKIKNQEVEKKDKNQKRIIPIGRDSTKKPNKITITKVMFGALGKVQTIDKYFVDVQVNGTLFRGYIDFKSAVCTIREETAKFAGLDYQRCYESVMGFNGYSVSTVGQVKAAIAVDQGLAIIDVYICPDHIQAIPVVVGQNFLRRPDILVMQDNQTISIYQQGENSNFPSRGLGSYPFAMQGNYVSSFISQ